MCERYRAGDPCGIERPDGTVLGGDRFVISDEAMLAELNALLAAKEDAEAALAEALKQLAAAKASIDAFDAQFLVLDADMRFEHTNEIDWTGHDHCREILSSALAATGEGGEAP